VFDLGADAAHEIWRMSLRSVEGMSDLLLARGEAERAELDRAGGYMLAERHTEGTVRGAYEAMRSAGLPVEWLSGPRVLGLLGGRGFCGGYRIDAAGAVDPGEASRALARAARESGARLVEGVDVRAVESCAEGFLVHTTAGDVRCSAVVYATNLGTGFLGEFGNTVVPVTAQAFLTGPVPPTFRGGFATEWKANVWRQRLDGRLVVSGWRHEALSRALLGATVIDPAVQTSLRAWFEEAFPSLGHLEVESEWSGTWGWTPDTLPIVGGLPGRSGEWVAAGFEGGGLAYAYEAGRAIAHAIVGDEPVPGARLLDPARLVHTGSGRRLA
jgi:glycine/D-amino acid oxidase-like deaminating enzyme